MGQIQVKSSITLWNWTFFPIQSLYLKHLKYLLHLFIFSSPWLITFFADPLPHTPPPFSPLCGVVMAFCWQSNPKFKRHMLLGFHSPVDRFPAYSNRQERKNPIFRQRRYISQFLHTLIKGCFATHLSHSCCLLMSDSYGSSFIYAFALGKRSKTIY